MSRGHPVTPSRAAAPIDRVDAAAFTIPTDAPESDGTLEWDKTTLVVVRVAAGDVVGLGYTYADASAAILVERLLADVIAGRDAMDVESCYVAMIHAVRNLGRQGIAATAISAVDIALWDAAPSVHAHLCCAVSRIRNLEYFHDHVRIERMLFDGALDPIAGALRPDRSRPGLGIEFKSRDAERFAV